MLLIRVGRLLVPTIILLFAGSAVASPADSRAENVRSLSRWYASTAGALLDSNLMTGGGTDDTVILQRILDTGKDGSGVHLIVEGPALVGGLDLHANTTVECTSGGGFYLKDDANRAMIRNSHRSRGAVSDKHITIRGCFLNGNRDRQRIGVPHGVGGRYVPLEPDGKTLQSGIQFFGVHHLRIENVVLWHVRSFGVWVANAKFVDISNVTVDTGLPPYPYGTSLTKQREYKNKGVNDDGLHFNGPIQYLSIDGLKLRTLDDALALNANDAGADDMTINNDMGPYVGQGPITDVMIRNVMLMDAHQGIRLLSRDQRIDRVSIQNVTGTVRQRVVLLSHFLNTRHTGNFGAIVFNNVVVDPVECPPYLDLYPFIREELSKNPAMWDVAEEAERPLFSINSPIESLILSNVSTRSIDRRPIVRVGPDAAVQNLKLELSVHDPAAQAVPLKLIGRIERMNVSMSLR